MQTLEDLGTVSDVVDSHVPTCGRCSTSCAPSSEAYTYCQPHTDRVNVGLHRVVAVDDPSGLVVSERLGHATTGVAIKTYQHVLPGMQADAANLFASLVDPSTGHPRWKARKKPA